MIRQEKSSVGVSPPQERKVRAELAREKRTIEGQRFMLHSCASSSYPSFPLSISSSQQPVARVMSATR